MWKRLNVYLVLIIPFFAMPFYSGKVEASRVVRVGLFQNYPVVFQDENGIPKGIYIDLLDEVAKKEKWDLKYIPDTWNNCLENLRSGHIDLMTNITYTKERDAYIDFSQENVLMMWGQVYVGKNIKVQNILDMQNLKVAVLKGGINAINFKNLVEKFEVNCELIPVDTQLEIFEFISSGKTDAGILNNVFGTAHEEKYDVKLSPILFNPFNLLFAVPEGRNRELLTTVDEYLINWKQNENSVYYKALQQWYGKLESPKRKFPRWVFFILGAACCIIILLFVWMRTLRFQVKSRTNDLKKANTNLKIEISDRKNAELSLRESERRLSTLIGNLPGIAYRCLNDEDWTMTYISDGCKTITGYEPSELIENRLVAYNDLIIPEDRPHIWDEIQLAIDENRPFTIEYRILDKSGTEKWVWERGLCVDKQNENMFVLEGFISDITDRKRAEDALRESEEKYRNLFENGSDLLCIHDLDGNILETNLSYKKHYGLRNGDLNSVNIHDFIPDRYKPEFDQYLQRIIQNGEEEGYLRFMAKPGKEVILEYKNKLIRNNKGKPMAVQGSARDATNRLMTEKALRESEEKFKSIFDYATDGILLADIETKKIYMCNQMFCSMFGYNMEEITNFGVEDLHPKEDLPHVLKEFEAQKKREKTLAENIPCLRKDGTIFYADINSAPVEIGGRKFNIGFFRDITDRKLAEIDRDRIHEQLLQAQKMESVGRLAGGVAHDFNNMLSVIMGYSEMILDELDPNNRLYERIKEILSAANRSTNITRQLLAFARQQTIAPKVLNLNETVENMLKMIRRLIGEDINIGWFPKAELWPIKIDPSQIDQIMANLCVNSRDAIEGVGRIKIETQNVALDDAYSINHLGFMPGEYVQLTISDDGKGMDAETLDKVFEPFYTTKGVGKGTGLGMSTVYGIVKQNNGYIYIYSEPGQGTTVNIYLPRYTDKVVSEEIVSTGEIPLSRGETILLVEDEISMLKLCGSLLDSMGYTVLTASTPSESISIADDHDGDINLLITDVVMPEMNGRELANQLLSYYPKLKVLYMSGYTIDTVAHHGILDKGLFFIQKPFSKQDFAVKVREVLD